MNTTKSIEHTYKLEEVLTALCEVEELTRELKIAEAKSNYDSEVGSIQTLLNAELSEVKTQLTRSLNYDGYDTEDKNSKVAKIREARAENEKLHRQLNIFRCTELICEKLTADNLNASACRSPVTHLQNICTRNIRRCKQNLDELLEEFDGRR